MNTIEVKGLSKKFPTFSLNNVSFALEPNTITGFIGVNGSGKTTTIRLLLGLCIADCGAVEIFGKTLKDAEKEIKNRIGVVFDEGYFYESLTLNEMKSILARAYERWDENQFKQYCQRFDLNLKQKIETLSKGMRMKYALALALSHDADLLIMDEPTSGLDPFIRSELMDILLEFVAKDGKSVLFSTHITSDLEKIADSLLLIDRGSIIFHEGKDELLERHVLIKGDSSNLSSNEKRNFLTLKETAYNYTGLIKRAEIEKLSYKDVVCEKATVEDIMLAYIGG